jgi:hypothetical protein
MDAVRFGQSFRISTARLSDGQLDTLSDLTSVGGRFANATVKYGTHGVETYTVPDGQGDSFQSALRGEKISAIVTA